MAETIALARFGATYSDEQLVYASLEAEHFLNTRLLANYTIRSADPQNQNVKVNKELPLIVHLAEVMPRPKPVSNPVDNAQLAHLQKRLSSEADLLKNRKVSKT